MKWAVLSAVLLGACTDGPHYLIVSVQNRPAVHDAVKLRVTLSNEGSMRSDDFDLGSNTFPITFSVTSPDRTGELAVTAEALDSAGLVVGRGAATSSFAADSATILLDTTDFVVNTTYAEDQFLSNDYEANGNQLAASDDGSFLVAFREQCSDPCPMLGRRFDKTGKPLVSAAAASTLQFDLSTNPTTAGATPAAAGSKDKVLAFWDYNDGQATPQSGVACRAIDATGTASSVQTSIAIESADVVSATSLSNGNVAVTWNALTSPGKIESAIVKPDCTTLGAVVPVATEASLEFFQRPVVGANPAGGALFAWISDGAVHARTSSNAGVFTSADTVVVAAGTTDQVSFIRVVPLGTGFGILARFEPMTGEGPGRIDLYRVSAMGAPVAGTPITVTDKSGGDFASVQSFGAAANKLGTILVAWHGCGTNGDDSGCGVFARAVTMSGVAGDTFVVPTTTIGDQTDPSVVAIGTDGFAVAWNDLSAQEPDKSKSAVRARIVYLDDEAARARPFRTGAAQASR